MFGNDLFATGVLGFSARNTPTTTPWQAIADRPYLPFKNMALYKNRAPHWNLKNGGIGTRWEATVGNLRIQLTNYFAFPDLPVTGWDRLNILNTPGCTTDGNGNSILPADRNEAPITAEQLADCRRSRPTLITIRTAATVANVQLLAQ